MAARTRRAALRCVACDGVSRRICRARKEYANNNKKTQKAPSLSPFYPSIHPSFLPSPESFINHCDGNNNYTNINDDDAHTVPIVFISNWRLNVTHRVRSSIERRLVSSESRGGGAGPRVIALCIILTRETMRSSITTTPRGLQDRAYLSISK